MLDDTAFIRRSGRVFSFIFSYNNDPIMFSDEIVENAFKKTYSYMYVPLSEIAKMKLL